MAQSPWCWDSATRYNDTPPFSITTCRYLTSSTCHQTTQVLDGLGRVKQSQDNSAGTYVDTGYDVLGRVSSASNPHTSGGEPSDGTTYYSYDALNRVTTIEYPDTGSSTVTYPNCAVTGITATSASIVDAAGSASESRFPETLRFFFAMYACRSPLLRIIQRGIGRRLIRFDFDNSLVGNRRHADEPHDRIFFITTNAHC